MKPQPRRAVPDGIPVGGEAVAVGCTIDTIQRAFAKFGPRLRTFLEGVRGGVIDAGFEGGDIWELTDEYGYELALSVAEIPIVGVRLFLIDAAECEGVEPGEEELLVNVMIEAIADSGRIILSYAPHNYTPEVWVDLRKIGAVDELAARIEYILRSEPETADALLPTLRETTGA